MWFPSNTSPSSARRGRAPLSRPLVSRILRSISLLLVLRARSLLARLSLAVLTRCCFETREWAAATGAGEIGMNGGMGCSQKVQNSGNAMLIELLNLLVAICLPSSGLLSFSYKLSL